MAERNSSLINVHRITKVLWVRLAEVFKGLD
jgi:hypothetical protein